MKPNSIVPGLIVGMLALVSGAAYAAEPEGLAMQAFHEALIAAQIAENASENVDEQDQARWVATHAQQALIALNHVQVSEEVETNQHITVAEHALNDAIKHGNMGRVDLAARSAEKAVKYLYMAYGYGIKTSG